MAFLGRIRYALNFMDFLMPVFLLNNFLYAFFFLAGTLNTAFLYMPWKALAPTDFIFGDLTTMVFRERQP